MKNVFFIFLMIALLGCAHVQKKSGDVVDIGEGLLLTLQRPSEILPEIQLVQLLKIDHPKGSHSAQVILNVKNDKMTVLSLLPFGGELFRVEYEKGEIMVRSLPVMDGSMDLRYALADIILVYADAKALQSWLSEGARVIDEPRQRRIRFRGQDLIQIEFSEVDKFKAAIQYEHFLRHYKISITPISQGKP